MITITDQLSIDEADLTERFVRASGPGGQNVNKVSTAVELRFDTRGVSNLPVPVRIRLSELAGRRLTKDGIIIIRAETHRTQELNRSAARARLIDLIARAAIVPKRRIRTRPSRAAKERRLKAKSRRSDTKQRRSRKPSLLD